MFALNMSHFICVFRNVEDINAATAITCTLQHYLQTNSAQFDICGELHLLYKSTDLLYMYIVLL